MKPKQKEVCYMWVRSHSGKGMGMQWSTSSMALWMQGSTDLVSTDL